MSKYQETSVFAAEYQRCYRIIINNPYNSAPSVVFEEEQIIKKNDGTYIKDLNFSNDIGDNLSKVISNMGEQYRLYNPITQTKTGQSIPISQIYAIIWSVYMEEALKRDANKAKNAVLLNFEKQNDIDFKAMEKQISDWNIEFQEQDVIKLEAAESLARTKQTEAEKKVVMNAYYADRNAAQQLIVANTNTLRSDFETERQSKYELALQEAQAAYDAIWN